MKVFLLVLFVLPCFAERNTSPHLESVELQQFGEANPFKPTGFESAILIPRPGDVLAQKSGSRSTTSTRKTSTTSSAQTYKYATSTTARSNSINKPSKTEKPTKSNDSTQTKAKNSHEVTSKDGVVFEFIDAKNETSRNSNAPSILQIKRNKLYKKRLMRSLWQKQQEEALRALEEGVGFDEVNDYKETALHLAAEQGNLKVVKLLLASGQNHSPRDLGGFTPLILAAREGHLEIVQILHKAGANLNDQDHGGTNSLMWAGFYGHIEVVKYLLNKRALKTAADKDGHSAIDYVDGDRYPKVHRLMRLLDIQPSEAGSLKGSERSALKYRRFEGVL